jgi:tRNA (cmo5U34)-methyltransferase
VIQNAIARDSLRAERLRRYGRAMADDHRVAGHLGVAADDYDKTIREFIPHYDRMLATVVHWLDGNVPAGGLVVDLGAGTGSLSAAILEGLPAVRVELVDVDPNMLEVAATRCATHAGRYELRHGRFEDEITPCRAVVASLALHHVATHEEKRDVYRAIFSALEPGGLVCVADALVYEEGHERERMLEDLSAHMGDYGISPDEAVGHLAQWAEEDYYVSLPDELRLIREAGFPHPDCFWREGLIAVYGGFKDG